MAIQEGLTLNGLELNNEAGAYVTEAVDLTPPKKKPEWAQGADSDGSRLIRTPLYENRVVTATVRVTRPTMNEALAKVGELVDQLQEAEKNPGGIPLEWTPANSTKKITLYVLTGEVTGIPIVMEGADAGYFAASIKVNISMTCKPFGYGAEVEAAAAKSIETGLSVVTLTVPTVEGDIPAEGRLVVKDTAAIGRRFVEWGLENRYYNAATSLILDSEDMTPEGGAQSTALNSLGAYKRAGATKGTIATTLITEPTICCSTGNLGHVGTYRIKARVYSELNVGSLAQNIHLRLSWQDGSGPFRANQWQTPNLVGSFVEVDLGTVSITPAQAGTQKWSGRIEAYSSAGAAVDVLHVDYIVLIPVLEGYGKARGVTATEPGTASAFDNFTTGTLSGSLNGRLAAIGGAWATSGATTDWAVTKEEVSRSTTTDSEARYGVIGSSLANSAIFIQGRFCNLGAYFGAVLRWTNKENLAFVLCQAAGGGEPLRVVLGVKVAGINTYLNETSIALSLNAIEQYPFSISAVASPDGQISTQGQLAGAPFSLAGSHPSLVTGGALASGKGGIHDQAKGGIGTQPRRFTSVHVAKLGAVPYCVAPSRVMEARSDGTLAQDSTGTYDGPVPQYRGARFFVPQDGSANRTSRILVKADRNDLEEADQTTIGDAFTAAVFVTPRYSVIPR